MDIIHTAQMVRSLSPLSINDCIVSWPLWPVSRLFFMISFRIPKSFAPDQTLSSRLGVGSDGNMT